MLTPSGEPNSDSAPILTPQSSQLLTLAALVPRKSSLCPLPAQISRTWIHSVFLIPSLFFLKRREINGSRLDRLKSYTTRLTRTSSQKSQSTTSSSSRRDLKLKFTTLTTTSKSTIWLYTTSSDPLSSNSMTWWLVWIKLWQGLSWTTRFQAQRAKSKSSQKNWPTTQTLKFARSARKRNFQNIPTNTFSSSLRIALQISMSPCISQRLGLPVQTTLLSGTRFKSAPQIFAATTSNRKLRWSFSETIVMANTQI